MADPTTSSSSARRPPRTAAAAPPPAAAAARATPPLHPSTAKKTPRLPPSASATRNHELEALRQRGLAKLLNRHFTETTKRVAKEKAAADAALRDLEFRKSQTSEFVPSGNGELSPMDAMAVRVNQWRSECRRKERETLLLYQRYVNKFGEHGHVQVPGMMLSPEAAAAAAAGMGMGPYEGYVPSTPSWAHQQDSSLTPSSTPRQRAPPPVETPPTRVPAVKQQIEQALDAYLETGGMELPSLESLGVDQTYQDVFHKNEVEFKTYYRKLLEKKGVDVRASAVWTPPEDKEQEKTALLAADAAAAANDPSYLRPTVSSPSSGTTLEHMALSSMPHDLIAGGPGSPYGSGAQDEEDDDDDTGVGDFLSANPYFVQEDYDDRSIVSGLTTVNSAETRRILQDCERSVATFLREEHNAIRHMMLKELDNEEDSSDEEDEEFAARHRRTSEIGSITKVAADQAEGMVQQMRSILDEFNRNNATSGQESDNETTGAIKAAKKKKTASRRIHTDNPDEHWVSYYDEKYQRYYYHEKNTNKTQWEPPSNMIPEDGGHAAIISGGGDSTSISEQTNTEVLSHDQVMPESITSDPYSTSVGSSRSRYATYRRQRRKARKRRVMALVLLLTTMVLAGAGYYYYEHEYLPALLRQQEQEAARLESMAVAIAPAPLPITKRPRPSLVDRFHQMEEHRASQEQAALAAAQALAQHNHRPWLCNIPLAYIVHGRCRRLAADNPVFDLHSLIQALMQ